MSRITWWLPAVYFLLAFALGEFLAKYPGEQYLAVLGRVGWQTAICTLAWYAPHTLRSLRRRARTDCAMPS